MRRRDGGFPRPSLKIDERKTGHERQVPVGEGVGDMSWRTRRIDRARVKRLAGLTNKHFGSTRGQRIGAEGIRSLLRRRTRAAGVAHMALHPCRRNSAPDRLGLTLPNGRTDLVRAVGAARNIRPDRAGQHSVQCFGKRTYNSSLWTDLHNLHEPAVKSMAIVRQWS